MTVFEPHMHVTGVRMCLDAIYQNTAETLTCTGYNHSWVKVYTYADSAAPLLPKGTILRLTGYFDNTPANRNVVDPRNWSGLGHRSIDNMMTNIGWGIALSDEEFEREMAERRQTLQLKEGEAVLGCPLCGYVKTENARSAAMRAKRLLPPFRAACGVLGVMALLGGASRITAQVSPPTGQNVVPAYEGWEENPDGSFNLLFGYFNRNWEGELDVPVGPDNNIEPGGPRSGAADTLSAGTESFHPADSCAEGFRQTRSWCGPSPHAGRRSGRTRR